MLDRFKVLIGLGNPAGYGRLSTSWRVALTAVQIVFVILLLLADSWTMRAIIVVAAAFAMALIAISSQQSAPE